MVRSWPLVSIKKNGGSKLVFVLYIEVVFRSYIAEVLALCNVHLFGYPGRES